MAEIQQIAREDLSKIELKNTTQSQRSCCDRQVVCSYLGTTVSSGSSAVAIQPWVQVGLTATSL